jgi:hypothetical protein
MRPGSETLINVRRKNVAAAAMSRMSSLLGAFE